MANNRLTPENVARTGLAATYLVEGAGAGQINVNDLYQVNNDGKVILHFKKSGASACTVTVTTPGTVDGLAIADLVVSIPATTGDIFMGPFPTRFYNKLGAHDVEFTTTVNVVGLTLAVLQLP